MGVMAARTVAFDGEMLLIAVEEVYFKEVA